jgi:hypothetical protein
MSSSKENHPGNCIDTLSPCNQAAHAVDSHLRQCLLKKKYRIFLISHSEFHVSENALLLVQLENVAMLSKSRCSIHIESLRSEAGQWDSTVAIADGCLPMITDLHDGYPSHERDGIIIAAGPNSS